MQIKRNLFFYKNKNGAIEVSLTELMGALLAVAIILLIIYVGLKLSGIFLSNEDYDSTMVSFDLLGGRLDSLVKDKNYVNMNLLYFLADKFSLVGLNYDVVEEGSTGYNEMLADAKRKIGGLCGKSCLCIYPKGELETPLKCKSFDVNVVFLAPTYQKNFEGDETNWHPQAYSDYYQTDKKYEFLILEGFNTEEIYLDKYESSDGDIFIFLAKYKDEPKDPIYERKKFMEEKYG